MYGKNHHNIVISLQLKLINWFFKKNDVNYKFRCLYQSNKVPLSSKFVESFYLLWKLEFFPVKPKKSLGDTISQRVNVLC